MDQLPRGNEGYPTHNNPHNPNNLFADSQQYNAYDNLFQPGADHPSYDASWGINASNYPVQSRAQHAAAPSWPQNANNLSMPGAHANVPAQAAPYARSLSHSPAPYGVNTFGGYGAPQTYQYRQPQYDPTLISSHAFHQNFNYPTADYQSPHPGTIAPHALQHENRSPSFGQVQYESSALPVNNFAQSRPVQPAIPETVDQTKLLSSIPKGKNGGRFSIITFDDLAKATNSERMGNFVNIGVEALNWDINRAALPPYVPRKSRNELRKLAANDPKLLARLGKTGAKKQRVLAAATKPLAALGKTTAADTERVKHEGESASEEDSSSSDDEGSSYTSDDADEATPLPEKRPSNPKDATEYDTIKALWRAKRKTLTSDSIRKGLGEFWDIVKTIRDRWKADVAAVQDAESKNRKTELPLLQSRVKDQRDMLETAFKAALKHGHREILAFMSENMSLLYLCYQFLLDRAKAEDYNSPLPRVLLETMSLFTTITDQKLEQTHLVKVIPRFSKKGDAKTQFYAKRITANAAALTKEKSAEPTANKSATKEQNATSPPSKKADPEPVAGIKRSASTASGGNVAKKAATDSSKLNGVSNASKQGGVVKKPLSASDTAKTTTSAAATAVKPKQVVAKPSGLFASLQSAGKKPGTSSASKAAQPTTSGASVKPQEKGSNASAQNAAPLSTFSFAETMANLSKPKEEKPAPKLEKEAPAETPEEKRKRLRKESRRHLRVSFKEGEDLVQVREFSHDPDEELGHDANQMRDLADVGGEGRMFKQQHQMMDIDDEDEVVDEEVGLLEFTPPSPIDFSDIDPEDRQRNGIKFGGEAQPESAERSLREEHEANTLLVFYTDVKDIPPNPREPSDPYNGEKVDKVKQFGAPEAKWTARTKQTNYPQQQSSKAPQQAGNPAPAFDLSSFLKNQNFPHQNNYQPTPQPPVPSSDAISNILASLKQAQMNQGAAPTPALGGFQPTPTPQPTAPPAGQPDLAAILAQIQQNQAAPQQQPPPPAVSSFGFNAAGNVANMNAAPQPNAYENPERKQWREGVAGNDTAAKSKKPQNTAYNPWYKTKVCKYWQEGRCQKGDQCTYKHEES